MRVEHTSPSPDLDYKVRANLTFETPDGARITIEEWSLKGLKWPVDSDQCDGESNREDTRDAGDGTSVVVPESGFLSIPFQGIDVRFPVQLEPAPDTAEIFFKNLTGRQRETLAIFYRSLLSGRMVSSGEVITSLDTPIDLVPIEETEAEAEAKIGPRWRFANLVRSIVHVAVYMTLCFGVLGVIGSNVFNAVNRIDIQHGRVVAPVGILAALQSGQVTEVHAAPGDMVAAGDLLVTIEDPDLAAKLKSVRVTYANVSSDLDLVEKGLARLDKLRGVKDEALRINEVGLLFEAHLGLKGFQDIVQTWQRLRDQSSDLALSRDPLEVTHRLLLQDAIELRRDLRRHRSTRDGYKAALMTARIVAAQDGVLSDVLVQPGQFVLRGQPVVEIEDDAPRHAVGWVSEKFAETIYPGMPATLGYNAMGNADSVTGRVSAVRAGDIPNRPGEYGIEVTVSIEGLTNAELRQALRVGAPVNLDADREMLAGPRRWVRDTWQRVFGSDPETAATTGGGDSDV